MGWAQLIVRANRLRKSKGAEWWFTRHSETMQFDCAQMEKGIKEVVETAKTWAWSMCFKCGFRPGITSFHSFGGIGASTSSARAKQQGPELPRPGLPACAGTKHHFLEKMLPACLLQRI